MTDDLVAFLRARLDEDEQIAAAAAGDGDGQWTRDGAPYFDGGRIEDASRGRVVVYAEGAPDGDEAAHIVRHDPARVLAEVAAKRALLNAYAEVAANDVNEPYEYAYGYANALGEDVRLLALPYTAHPDFRPEWAPDA